ALDDNNPIPALWLALNYLGQQPPVSLRDGSLAELWQWAIEHWSLARVPRQTTLPLNQDSSC
ncbi:MAG TPA: hypothetical protein VL381_08330, partial [Rhodocyclaceae bacterium]|nr:hypothetical protein [Rhodocyclaceae bacterium]